MTDLARTLLVTLILTVLLVVLFHFVARGQPTNFPPEHHPWLNRQTSPAGVKCCDHTDCHVVPSRIAAGRPAVMSGYQARYRNAWIDIPTGAVARAPNPVGEAILCISPTLHVWCYFPALES